MDHSKKIKKNQKSKKSKKSKKFKKSIYSKKMFIPIKMSYILEYFHISRTYPWNKEFKKNNNNNSTV